MNRRVVITGLGCLSGAGTEPKELRRALLEGKSLARRERIDLNQDEWFETSVSRLPEFDRNAYLPAERRRRMSVFSQNWVVACLQARADAGLSSTPVPERAGVILGTAFGSLHSTLKYLDIVRRDGKGLGNPFLFSESVANAPAGHAGIDLDCRGLNVSLTCGDMSGLAAVQCAARAIRDERLDFAYAGGVEELPPALLAILARLGAVPVSAGNLLHRLPQQGRTSASVAPGEGAACFILEEWEQARRRGAVAYAEVLAGSLGSDPRAGDMCWSRSVSVRAKSMLNALRTSSVATHAVDGVILHGCADLEANRAENDAVEGVLLQERSSVETLALMSPAPVLGQFAGAAAFGVAAAALSLRYQERYDAPGDSPTVPLNRAETSSDPLRSVLVNGASWGGGCMSLVLTRAV